MRNNEGLAYDFIINPFNVIDSKTAQFKQEEQKWRRLINKLGELANIQNATHATREDCWKGAGTLSEAITGKRINNGASVLSAFLCEIMLHWFLPNVEKPSVVDVFAGGVQMGVVSGNLGCFYRGLEIRKNQADANNAIFDAANFNAATYNADGTSKEALELLGKNNDLFFTCPPYHGVEIYKDYGGIRPEKEINNKSYTEYLTLLEKGIKNGIDAIKDDRFCIVMIGESRQKNKDLGHNIEVVRETYRKNNVKLINDITFLEQIATRAYTGRGSMKSRILAKVSQSILVGYKGDVGNIKIYFEKLKRKGGENGI